MTAELVGDIQRAGSFWRLLDDAERSAFTKAGRMRRYQRKATLMRAGEAGSWAILRRGSVRLTDGTRVLGSRRPGDFVGEQALLGPAPLAFSVLAATDVHAIVLDGRTFDSVLDRHPRVLWVLCAALTELIGETYQRLAEETDEAFTKVVRYLLRQASGSDFGGHRVSIHIGSQSALASALGVSRHSVGRALGRLRTEHIVSTPRGMVVVRDLDRLRMATTP